MSQASSPIAIAPKSGFSPLYLNVLFLIRQLPDTESTEHTCRKSLRFLDIAQYYPFYQNKRLELAYSVSSVGSVRKNSYTFKEMI